MSTSIGYSSAINGSNVAFANFAANPKNLGGAINGWMPQTNQTVDKKYVDFEQIRFTLKNAWNTTYPTQLKVNKLNQTITTPFRAINNAGDILSRENYSCGGPCQTFQSRPGLHGLRQNFGAISTTCVPSAAYNSLQLINNIPAAACNVKYVYDSSDYTRYLKQKAVNLNYNDLSFGGDQSNASQVAWKAIRRY
jgi:hypothetical protein